MAQKNDLKPDDVAFLVENGFENDIPDHGLTSIQPIVQPPTLIVQPDIWPTKQVSIGQEIIPFMPTAPPSISVEFVEQNHRSEGESDVPDHLNCAVFLTGFPTTIPKDQLYFELFKFIGSIGSIVSSIIYDQGANHRSPAARLTFRHPLPAAQLRDRARETGIWMYSSKLSVRYNRYGHREQNRRLHYQSRVVIVTVVNYPSWDLAYWMDFVDRICDPHLESSGYLPQSKANRLVMEFRFARIHNEAQKLVLGIKNSREFWGKVYVRYSPDVPRNPLHHRPRAGS